MTSAGEDAAFDALLAPAYASEAPHTRWRMDVGWEEGGPDPLDQIVVYAREQPVRHWHYVSHGLSVGDGTDGRGWPFELSARLTRAHEGEPPAFMAGVLQNLSRYVVETQNSFSAGDFMDLRGPILEGASTPVDHVLLVRDGELGTVDGPSGTVTFLQVVGITADEVAAKQSWTLEGFAGVYSTRYPLGVTRLDRDSVLREPGVLEVLAAGRERDGSSTQGLVVEALEIEPARGLRRRQPARIVLEAIVVDSLCLLLPLRLGFGRPLELHGRDARLTFTPGTHVGLHRHSRQDWQISLTPAQADALARNLCPLAGTYRTDEIPMLEIEVSG